MKYTTGHTWEIHNAAVDLLLTFDVEPYKAARTSGPPEDCYEASGGYAAFVSAKVLRVEFPNGSGGSFSRSKHDWNLMADEARWYAALFAHQIDIGNLEQAAYTEWFEKQKERSGL